MTRSRLGRGAGVVVSAVLIAGCGGGASGGTTSSTMTSQAPGVSSGVASPKIHESTKTSPSSATAVVTTPTTTTPTTTTPAPTPPVSALTLCRRQIAAKTGLTDTQRKLLDKLCVQIRGPKQTTTP